MKKFSFYLSLSAVAVILLAYALAYSQNLEWLNYMSGNDVSALVAEGNYIWAGTTGGLAMLDKTSGVPSFYNKFN
jgi:hypothetical protein